MSLATNVTDLATRIATETKSLRTLINGNAAGLSGLNTAAKSNLVAAINELFAAVASASGIDDSVTSLSTSWSSTKTDAEISSAISALVASSPAALDTLKELADALGGDANFSTTITTALGNRVRVDAAQSLTGPQQTQARANIGAGTSNVAIGTTTGTAADAALLATSLAGKAATSHTHTAAQISDATATGRSVLQAATAAAARTAIGAGTPYTLPDATETVVGGAEIATTAEVTTGTDDARIVTPAKLAARLTTILVGYAAASHTHTAAQISDAGATGRVVLQAANAAAGRSAIGAGTSNLAIGTTVGTAADAAAVGDTAANFVTTFEAGLI